MRFWRHAFLSVIAATIICHSQDSLGQQGANNATQGLSPSAAYNAGELDNVNPATGTVMLQIPILSYPQRGKLLQLNFKLYYNNANWFISNWPQPTQPNAPRNAPAWKYANDLGLGNNISTLGGAYVARDQHLSFGSDSNTLYYNQGNTTEPWNNQVATSIFTSNFVREPNGAKHYYSDVEDMSCTAGSYTCASYPPHFNPTLYAAHDGSGFVPSQASSYSGFASTILGPDGLSYSRNAQGFDVITDPSGNSITASSSGWADSLGHQIPGSIAGPGTATGFDPGVAGGNVNDEPIPGVSSGIPSSCPGAAAARQWSVPAVNGTTQTYYLCYSDFPYHTAFNANTVNGPSYSGVAEASGTARLLSAVVLPNAQKYSLSYDGYLSLSQIITPTGAIIQYVWQSIMIPSSTGSTPMGRVLQTRTIIPGGNQPSRTYQYTWNIPTQTLYGLTSPTSPIYTIVTDPTGADTEYQVSGTDLSNSVSGQAIYAGCSPHHIGCSGSSSTALKTTTYAYTPFTSGVSAYPLPSYYAGQKNQGEPTTTTTTWQNGQTMQVQRVRTSRYGTCQATSYQPYGGSSISQSAHAQSSCNQMDQTASNTVSDYGSSSPGAVIKTMNTCYQWENASTGAGYLGANLMNLPQVVAVISGSSTDQSAQRCRTGRVVAQTQYLYDESPSPQGAPRGNLTSVVQGIPGGNQPATHTVFNTFGMPTQLTDPNSNPATTYYYDATNAFLSEIDYPAFGGVTHVEHFTYDVNTGKLLAHTDQNNQGTTYSYVDPATGQNDVLNRLHKITYPATQDGASGTAQSATVQYSYTDTPGSLSLTESKLRSFRDGTQAQSTTSFDNLGETTQTASVEDSSHTLYVDTHYDSSGHVASVSNPYRTQSDVTFGLTTSTYDALGRTLGETHPDGSTHSISYNGSTTTEKDEAGVTWVRQADALGRMTSVQESGSSSDPHNFNTIYGYDLLGNLLSASQSGSGTDGTRARRFGYDSLSRLIWSNNPETGTICYGTTPGMQAPASDGSNCSPLNGYDLNGNLRYRTDARGVQTTFNYDALNRLTSKTYSGSGGGSAIALATPPAFYQYDRTVSGTSVPNSVGRLVSEATGSQASPTTGRFVVAYDAMGRVLEEKQCEWASQCASPITDFQYVYDLLGGSASSSSGLPGTPINFTYARDQLDRLTSVSSSWNDASHPATLFAPPSSGLQYSPAGLAAAQIGVSTSSQQALYSQQRSYDNRMRVVGESDTVSGTGGVRSQGLINIAGTEQQGTGGATAATGSVTVSGVEGFTQNCGGPSPNSTTLSTASATASGAQPNYIVGCTKTYDQGQMNITVQSFTASVGYGQASTRVNLATGLAAALNASGSPVTATSSGSVISIVSKATGVAANYSLSSTSDGDFTGSPSGATLTGGSSGGTTYDAGTIQATVNGTSASATFGAGSTLQSVVSALASAMQSADSSFLTASVSGTSVQLTSVHGGSTTNWPVSVSVSYDSTDFSHASFVAAANGMSGGAAGTPLYSYSVPQGGYAGNGNLIQVDDTVMGHWTYSYDGLNRLASGLASASSQNSSLPYGSALLGWSYDSFGNFKGQTLSGNTQAVATQVPYDYSTNSLNRIDSQDYLYDASGNVTHGAGTSFSFDAENRVRSVNGSTSYVYDAESHRVARVNSAGQPTSFYLLGLGGEQVSELNGQGQWLRTNVYGDGKELATYDANGLHFAFTDWLGNRRVQASGTGQVEETCRNLPYGDSLQCLNSGGQVVTPGSSPDANDHHFTGKERDAESGLDYFGARYYGSNMGRWMSPDWSAQGSPIPYANIGRPQSLNLYAYVDNNPLSRSDADGHDGHLSMSDYAALASYGQQQQTLSWMAGMRAATAAAAAQQQPAPNATNVPSGVVMVGGTTYSVPTEVPANGGCSSPCYFMGTIYTYQVVTASGTPITTDNMVVTEQLNPLTGGDRNGGTAPGATTTNGTFADAVGMLGHTPDGFPSHGIAITAQTFFVDVQGPGGGGFQLTTSVLQVVRASTNTITGSPVVTGSSTITTP